MFKCFKFIDDMMKQLNEADEMPMEDDAEMSGDETATEEPDAEGDMEMEGGEAPAEDGAPMEGGAEQDPSQIAEVDNGTFVSDLGKAEIAKSLLKALTLAKPNDTIPVEFQTVTTENANDIIQYVKTMLQIDNDEFGNELNNI